MRQRRPAVTPQDRLAAAVKFAVENLEQRVMLSTATPLLQSEANAVKAGLVNIVSWADTLESFGALAQSLPGVNRSLASVTNISDLIQAKLAAPINALGSTPSPDDIVTALQGILGPNTVAALTTASEIRFDVNTTLNAAPVQVNLDLGPNADALSLDASTKFTLNSAVSLNFSFGLALGEGLAASEAFFVKLKTDNASNPTGLKVTGSLAANGFNVALGGKVGFLEVGIGDGTAASTIALGAEVKLGLNDPNAADGHITLAELMGNSLSALVSAPAGSASGTINANIPVSASVGTFAGKGAIAVTDANVFDATKPTVGFTLSDPLKDFRNFKNITPRDAVAMLQQLGASLQGITDTLSPIGGIPFLEDALGDLVNFGDEFHSFSGGFFDAVYSGANSYAASNAHPSFDDGAVTFSAATFQIAVGDGTFDDGEFKTVTVAGGTRADANALVSAINTALSTAGVAAAASVAGDRITFTGNAGALVEMRFAGDDRGMRQFGFVATLANARLKFDSVQTFLDRLNALDLLGNVGELNADYANDALTLRLRIDQSFHDHIEFHFGDAIDLGIGELSVTGHAHAHFDIDVELDLGLGIKLTPIGGGFTLLPTTQLKTLNGGTTFFDAPNDGKDDFKILLTNGTSELVNLDALTGNSTIADLQALIQGIGAPNLTLALVPDATGQTGQNVALRLIDSSGGSANALTVQRLNESLGARVLGIEGSDVIANDGLNQITGAPLHGDSFQKHIFLKEGSKLDASATLAVPDDDKINLIAALGILEVGIVDGTGSISIGTGLVLNDPGTGPAADARVHLDELLNSPLRGVVTAAAVGPANGQLSANGAFDLNINGIGNVAVTLTKDAANASLADLIEDIQTALGATSFTSAYDGTAFEGKKLGDVIFAGSKDGKITLTGLVGTVAISFTAGNPINELGFTSGATSSASLIESGHLTASGSLHLPLTFPGIEYLSLVTPADPSIDLSFSSGSPIDYVPTVAGIPNTADILKLVDFDSADFLTMIKQIVGLLQNKDLGLLNQPLPLLDKSINDVLAFADPIVEAFDALMAKMGNLKQALLTELRGAAVDATDPESIRGLIAGANGTALMGGLEQLQKGMALKFADALDSLEAAVQTLPDSINLDTFKLPGRIVAAIGQFKEVLGEARGVIKDAGGAASAEVKALFNKLEGKVYALKRSVPGVQQLSDFLFEALGLRKLIKEDMLTAIKSVVVPKIQQAADAIDRNVNAAHAAAKEAFQKVHDELQEVLAPVVSYSEDISKLDLVALLQSFNNLVGAISAHAASGVLVNDPAIETEPLQLLNEALGRFSSSFPGRLRFNFDAATKRLAIGLDVSVSGANKEAVSLDFALPGNIPVKLSTVGNIPVGGLAVGANLAFDFGLALDPADTADFLFLFPTSHLAFTALLEASGLKIDASIGGISAVKLGSNADGGTFFIKKDLADAANHEPASITVTLDKAGGDANSNGLVEFSELLASTKIDPVGGLKLNFPDVAVLGSSLGEPLSVTVPLPSLLDPSSWVFEIPSFDFSDIKLDLGSLFDGIDAFLGFIVNAFESKLLKDLPLVGDDLGAASLKIEEFKNFLAKIRTATDAIADATSVAGITDALQRLMFDTLGPGLPGSPDLAQFNLDVTPLNILTLDKNKHDDGSGNATADYRDVDILVKIDEDGADNDPSTAGDNKNLLTDPNAAIEARFTFAGQETWNPTFDIGFDAFGLIGAAAEGGIDLTLGYHAEVGIKLDKQKGFSILLNPSGGTPDLATTPATGQDPELEAGVTLGLQDGTKLKLNLFFLTLTAADADTDGDGKKTGFSGGAALDFNFGGSSEVPLLDLLDIGITPALAVDVFADLRLNAGLDNPNLPSIRADLVADWGFDLTKPEADRVGDLNLALNNLGLDLGLFVSQNLKPILERVNQFLEPIRPLLDFLQLEVPIVSQLYQLIGQGPFTFLDGISMLGEGGESVAKVVGLLTQVDAFASQIGSLENLFIEFGDFDFGNIGNGSGELNVNPFEKLQSLSAAFGSMNFTDKNGAPVDGTPAKDKLTAADDEEDGLGLDFPLITNPANALKLLLGQDADLITWDIPRLAAKFDFAQIFGPIVPPFPIFAKIGGGFEIFLDLYVGLDTRGIRTGIDTGKPGDFLKGFYFGDFADGATGDETPEAGISMYLTAGAELNIPFAKAGVEGGIKAKINADWHDEGSPGKVYLDEILLNLQRGVECIFDLNGELSAFLGAYLEIVIPLGFTDITIINVNFTIIEVTLLDFSITCPPLPPPEPAAMSGSKLLLNIGNRAGERQPGATDGDDIITVRGEFDLNGDGVLSKTEDKNGDGKIAEEELGEDLDNNGKVDNGVVAVIGYGQTRLFGRSSDAQLASSFFKSTTLVTGIEGHGGEGEDSILFQNVVLPATLSGGAADDEIVGGDKGDSIDGGDGNDQISGGGGKDTIKGDGGNDELFGGDDADTINGNGGDDTLYGGNNNNKEQNDGGDLLRGDDGNDMLYGHAGNDTAEGGTGADFLGGSVGDDVLKGGDDDDTILGEDDNDVVEGGSGNDQLKGGIGNDTVHGDAGDDYMEGGDGVDSMRGGAGHDRMIGGRADATGADADQGDLMHGDAGNDTIAGGNAIIGSITLIGGAGNDTITGGSGNDLIYGQGGVDIIYGDDATINVSAPQYQSAGVGSGGNDVIYGNEGADIIVAGDGRDQVFGGDDTSVDVILGDNGLINLTSAGVVTNIESSNFTFGDADTLRGNAGDDIVIGGRGADSIFGNEGRDILIGDHGRVQRDSGNALIKISTIGTAQGSHDTILGYDGDDTVLGGVGDDSITGNIGADVLLGDNGELNYSNGILTTILSTNVADFGDDLITGAENDDTVIGGSGKDDLSGGSHNDIILGDNAKVTRAGTFVTKIETTNAGTGDGDTILGGTGADTAFGGDGDDSITGGADASDDVLGGDNGFVNLVGGVVTLIESTDPTQGGSDSIWGGNGNDIVVGGSGGSDLTTAATPGGDSLFGEGGEDIMIGDNVRITREAYNVISRIETIFPDKGGLDRMYGAAGSDTMMGGFGSDSMEGGFGNDVMLGDNGRINYATTSGPPAASVMVLITTTDPTLGDSDLLYGQDGDDTIMGGTDDESIGGGNGRDLIFGDHGKVDLTLPSNENFFSIDTAATDGGGTDTIHGDADEDTILGGQNGDSIFGDGQDDDIVGGHNNSADVFGGRSDGDDTLDGGTGDDVVAGDNAQVVRQAGPNYTSPLVRTLDGSAIYGADGSAQVNDAPRGNPTGAVGRNITLLDHADNTPAGRFGNDLMTGGADDDTMFGQLGNDTMRGDGFIDTSGAAAAAKKSAGNATDGDDYMEGNGGEDLMHGDLGQDDMVGGSSDLFGLTTPAMRPDAADVMYGGDGTDTARNILGDTSATGHARDADVMLGDNANVYRLVSVNLAGVSSFLGFNYDNYGSLKLVPRATTLLDYNLLTPAGDETGGNDLMHGEAGDDSMHGMTGHDTMFAEGQDDDVIGGMGNDWISGGTGSDGVLGDDGRIATSRNGSTEPLSGVAVATAATLITTPGKIQTATINVAGTLKKVVNLTPFSTDPNWAGQADEFAGGNYDHTSDDVMYGGWGDDSMHGGSGDDAISGAEALPLAAAFIPGIGVVVTGYDNPVNVGNMLAFNPEDADAQHFDRTRRAGEFALYDEYSPLTRVTITDGATLRQFLLNFDPNEGPVDPTSTSATTKRTDGNDRIFGDLGNDWLVGGTGRDNLYGGFGNDLMNADDDHATNAGANDAPDTDASFEDRAYGGAGRDVLIGNTGGDRLIDWVGEFNSYLVPFAPFGMATVSRTLQPQLPEFLLALSAADGADNTRAADTGADPLRNGEPEGELGMVLQKDAGWQTQTGAPADPQAGNIPGGKRDVLRTANFNGNETMGFVAETGLWQVSGGRYNVEPAQAGGDAVSLFNADEFLPSYFEVLATVNAAKPNAGMKANAYLLFDYQSPTDFKFAGVNVSTNSIEIGHRTAAGWIVDTKTPMQLKPGQDYNLLLAVNGNGVMLVVNNQVTLSHAFPARRDADGYAYTISQGMVGLGGAGAKAQIDNVVIQKLLLTTEKTTDFAAGTGGLLDSPTGGTWSLVGGRYQAAPTGTDPAIALAAVQVAPNSLIQMSSRFRLGSATSEGGFVFDYYSEEDFKFVVISAESKQVLLGHRTARGGWVIDARFNINAFQPSADYTLGLTLKGTTVNVTLNGSTVISRTYNALGTDGGFGLFSRNGTSLFDALTLGSDDPDFV